MGLGSFRVVRAHSTRIRGGKLLNPPSWMHFLINQLTLDSCMSQTSCAAEVKATKCEYNCLSLNYVLGLVGWLYHPAVCHPSSHTLPSSCLKFNRQWPTFSRYSPSVTKFSPWSSPPEGVIKHSRWVQVEECIRRGRDWLIWFLNKVCCFSQLETRSGNAD